MDVADDLDLHLKLLFFVCFCVFLCHQSHNQAVNPLGIRQSSSDLSPHWYQPGNMLTPTQGADPMATSEKGQYACVSLVTHNHTDPSSIADNRTSVCALKHGSTARIIILHRGLPYGRDAGRARVGNLPAQNRGARSSNRFMETDGTSAGHGTLMDL